MLWRVIVPRVPTALGTLGPVLSDTLILRQAQDERGVEGPADRRLTSRWVSDDANYFATTLVHHSRVTADEADALHRRFERSGDARVAVDLIERQLMIGRVMAPSGACFAAARAEMRRALLASVFQNPGFAGRK